MNAPGTGTCRACGRPLDSKPFWLTHRPDGVHADCCDWSKQPFPFDGELERLRRMARGVRNLWTLVVREGLWLADMKRGWPHSADVLVRQWKARRAKFQAEVERMKKRLRL